MNEGTFHKFVHLYLACNRQWQLVNASVCLMLGLVIVELGHNNRVKLLRLTVRVWVILGGASLVYPERTANN